MMNKSSNKNGRSKRTKNPPCRTKTKRIRETLDKTKRAKIRAVFGTIGRSKATKQGVPKTLQE